MRQTLTKLKGEIDSSTITFRGFNTRHSIMDRTSRQKICREIEDLKNTINQLDLIRHIKTLYPTRVEDTFSSCTHGTFSRIGYTLGRKTSLDTFLSIKLIQNIFSNHNGMKLEVQAQKENWKTHIYGN